MYKAILTYLWTLLSKYLGGLGLSINKILVIFLGGLLVLLGLYWYISSISKDYSNATLINNHMEIEDLKQKHKATIFELEQKQINLKETVDDEPKVSDASDGNYTFIN